MVRFSFTVVSNTLIISSFLDSFAVINSLVIFAERTSSGKMYSTHSLFSHIIFECKLDTN